MKNTMKKPRSRTTDELALVKAAAWAWYMRGAGAEDDPSREFDLARERRPPQPTRFKLEAERASAATTTTTSPSLSSSSTGSLPPSPAHTDNSLLDAYEVEMITRQLDLFIASGNSVSYQSIKKNRDKNNKSYSSWIGRPLNGFWLRQAMGMCRPARGTWWRRRCRPAQPAPEEGLARGPTPYSGLVVANNVMY